MHFDKRVASSGGLAPHRRDVPYPRDHAVDIVLILLISPEIEAVELFLHSRHIPIIPLLELLRLLLPV